jgi:hypothetical protein
MSSKCLWGGDAVVCSEMFVQVAYGATIMMVLSCVFGFV